MITLSNEQAGELVEFIHELQQQVAYLQGAGQLFSSPDHASGMDLAGDIMLNVIEEHEELIQDIEDQTFTTQE